MSRISKRLKESYIAVISCMVLLTLLCFVLKNMHNTMKQITTPPFEVEVVKDISNDANIIEVSTSKYMEEGEYSIIFEVIGNDKTTVTDMDEFSYENWIMAYLTRENTYRYNLEAEYSGPQLIKITISGENDERDFIIPFEDR